MINHGKPLPLTTRDLAMLKSTKVEAPPATPAKVLAARYVAWAVEKEIPVIRLWSTERGPGANLRNETYDEVTRLLRNRPEGSHIPEVQFLPLEER